MCISRHLGSVRFDADRPMQLAWLLLAAIVAVNTIACTALGATVDLAPALFKLAVGAALLAVAAVYTWVRADQKLAALAEAGAFLILCPLALAISSYLGAMGNRPLWDGFFAAADRQVGFDFLAHLGFVAANPAVATVLDYCYGSSIHQVGLTAVLLALCGHTQRLQTFLLLFAVTAATVIALATIMPTMGTYAYYNVPDTLLPAFRYQRSGWDQVAHLTALRDGSMRAIPLHDLHGIISFPSFHTALAVLTCWALFPLRLLRAPVLLVNAILIIGTPTLGSHYVSDVFGGTAITIAAIWLVRTLATRAQRTASPAWANAATA
jgi:PAP2 superfamily